MEFSGNTFDGQGPLLANCGLPPVGPFYSTQEGFAGIHVEDISTLYLHKTRDRNEFSNLGIGVNIFSSNASIYSCNFSNIDDIPYGLDGLHGIRFTDVTGGHLLLVGEDYTF